MELVRWLNVTSVPYKPLTEGIVLVIVYIYLNRLKSRQSKLLNKHITIPFQLHTFFFVFSNRDSSDKYSVFLQSTDDFSASMEDKSNRWYTRMFIVDYHSLTVLHQLNTEFQDENETRSVTETNTLTNMIKIQYNNTLIDN